jgi:cyclopropane fatty-acyl-phospholipid synthase-like methyltransferase
MNGRAPERLVAAVDGLDVRQGDRVLEIGCGRGVAAQLIARRLTDGQLVALDRSAAATAAAVERNAEAVANGVVRFVTMSMADVDPAVLGRFDRVFAVNVNLFWVGPARRELHLIRELLKPAGVLVLCYDPPRAEQVDRLRTTLVEHLASAGFRASTRTRPLARSTLLLVHGRPEP